MYDLSTVQILLRLLEKFDELANFQLPPRSCFTLFERYDDCNSRFSAVLPHLAAVALAFGLAAVAMSGVMSARHQLGLQRIEPVLARVRTCRALARLSCCVLESCDHGAPSILPARVPAGSFDNLDPVSLQLSVLTIDR